MARHDLLGLQGPGLPDDEYRPEAAEVVRLVSRIATPNVDDVARVVRSVFTESFEVDLGSDTSYEGLAAEILARMRGVRHSG